MIILTGYALLMSVAFVVGAFDMSGWEILFWGSVGLVAYAYLGYPMLVGLLSRLVKDPARDTSMANGDWPFVSLVIAAYKEEGVILERIQNALLMDYPADRLEILFGCDGNEDATAELVSTIPDSRIRLFAFPKRRGKPSVLNDCVAAARGEILAFSDANTFWDRDALKKIVRHFGKETVGGVCGQLFLTDPVTGENVDGMYWKYENFLKRCEGRLRALLGFNGAIYAIRRELWEPIPPQTIVDDFLIGMRIYLRNHTLIFDESAVAREESAPSIGAEFHRRARIGAGGFQSLCWLSRLLNPKYGSVALAFWSHKVLRWLCPLFLVAAAFSNIVLAGSPLYAGLLAAQVMFYGLALLGRWMPGRGLPVRIVRLFSLFVGMNTALGVGFWRWASNRQSGAWKRTARSAELKIAGTRSPRISEETPQSAEKLVAARSEH